MSIRTLINRLFSTRVPAKAPAPAPVSLEEAILNSKRQLLEVFDGIEDPILITGSDYKILRLNKAALSMLDGRKTYSDHIGRYCYEVLHRKSSICNDCRVVDIFSTGKRSPEPSIVERVKDGAVLTFDVSSFPLKDSKGSVYAVVQYYKDVTHTKKLEAELYDAERSRLLGSVAVGLAHEIRNPLAIISSTAQLIKSEFSGDSEIFEGMETIIRHTDQANNVIGDLLEFSKPKDTTVELIDIERLLESGLRLVKKQLDGQKIKLRKKFDGNIPKLRINGQGFIQAFVSFLLNAADKISDGGDINVEVLRAGNSVQIIIKDTGLGFSPEVTARIFKPFLRARGGTESLRLPIASDIIRTFGGTVDFQSKEGAGSTAIIKLPLV